jgi:hypothetical protein
MEPRVRATNSSKTMFVTGRDGGFRRAVKREAEEDWGGEARRGHA